MTARVPAWSVSCALLAAMVAIAACGSSKSKQGSTPSPAQSQSSLVPGGAVNRPPTIRVQSRAFADRSRLPRQFTCSGAGKSPPVSWTGGVPRGTRSLVLLLEDPDAPGGTFMHWSVYALQPKVHGLAAGAVPAGALQGRNSAGRIGYAPPCPPPGDRPHRYVFSLYAVPHRASFGAGADITAVRRLAATATARGVLTATYSR